MNDEQMWIEGLSIILLFQSGLTLIVISAMSLQKIDFIQFGLGILLGSYIVIAFLLAMFIFRRHKKEIFEQE